ncbi:MAG TPA: hypothetical protein PK339_06145 [Flavitalea sp.]|nr:hypothetical protein [Flavitalea sp.]
MNRIKYSLLILVGLSAFVFASCKKDKDADKVQLLTVSVWKYDTAAIDQNNDGVMDQPIPSEIIGDCAKDNTISFAADGSGISDEGALKCDEEDPQTTPFTWTLGEGQSSLILDGNLFAGIDGEFKLITLTNSRMELSKMVDIIPGVSVNVILRLKH